MSSPEDLSQAFLRAFQRIHRERMSGLPLINEALQVNVLGWRAWEGHRVGVLITPWSMNLVCVPGSGQGAGTERILGFPSGDYCFVDAEEPDIGSFAMCSLFSPVFEFDSQDAAEATASAALEALFDQRCSADARDKRKDRETTPPKTSMSRRDLLRGAFLRTDNSESPEADGGIPW